MTPTDCISVVEQSLKQGEPSAALRFLQRVKSGEIPHSLYFSLRGDVLMHQLRFYDACQDYKKSIQLEPMWATPYNGLGNALVEFGEYQEALSAFNNAIIRAPEAIEFTFNRAQLYFLLGDWARGRADYERRLSGAGFQAHPAIAQYPVWLGEPIPNKKLLLHWEQGQGDTLQFIRYGHCLIDQGAKLVIEAQGTLRTLLQASFPQAQVITSSDPLPDIDLRAAIPSLPWIMGELPNAVYAPASYLSVPEGGRIPDLRSSNICSVGLVWSGNPNHINDKQRSLSQETLLELTQLAGVEWYSLQVGASDKARRALLRAGVRDLAPGFTDFADTAAAIQALDLVITVDTSVAHLAGALGKPVWVLLPFVPDWRWLLDRSDSPWYPSARLFRQPKRGDWTSVLKEVKQALAQFRDQRGANSAA